jgi:hypothetical protein
MKYLTRVAGRNANEIVADAERKVAEFAGDRDWSIEDITTSSALMRGDGFTLVHYADVEAWVEGP